MSPVILRFAALFAAVIGAGTVFFRIVEGWGWIDAYYFTFATISTVGYGDLTPATDSGKIGATVLIVVGFSVFFAAIERFSRRFLPVFPRQKDEGR